VCENAKRAKETAIVKILKLLENSEYSQQEMAEKLNMPEGTVRSTISTLRSLGLVTQATGKRGIPFKLTDEGRGYIGKQKV